MLNLRVFAALRLGVTQTLAKAQRRKAAKNGTSVTANGNS